MLEVSSSDSDIVVILDRLAFKRGCLEQKDTDNLDRPSLLGAWCVQCRSGREAPDLPVLGKHHRDTLRHYKVGCECCFCSTHPPDVEVVNLSHTGEFSQISADSKRLDSRWHSIKR